MKLYYVCTDRTDTVISGLQSIFDATRRPSEIKHKLGVGRKRIGGGALFFHRNVTVKCVSYGMAILEATFAGEASGGVVILRTEPHHLTNE